jgi:hypothetical protein
MVHSAIGIAPSQFTDSDILAIWQRLNKRQIRLRNAKAKSAWDSTLELVRRKCSLPKAENKITPPKYSE